MSNKPMSLLQKLNMSSEIEWTPEKEENIFFNPLSKNIEIDGQPTKFNILYRNNGGVVQAIKPVTGIYKPILNSEIDEVVSESDIPMNLNMKLSSNYKNGKFILVYDVKDTASELIDEETKLFPRIIVYNSYDGTSLLRFQLGMFRMFCANLQVAEVKGMTFTMSEKHCRGNFTEELKEKVHPWLQNVLSKECFIDLNERIQKMKERKDVILTEQFLSNFTPKKLIVLLSVLERYNQSVNLMISDSKDEITHLTKSSVLEYLNDEDAESKFDDVQDSITYNEPVLNQWHVYCLLVKLTQMMVKSHQRINVSRLVGQQFWK
jgi:hypothetical protein